MKPDELKAIVDLAANEIEARLCAKGFMAAQPSDAERLARLRADIDTLSQQLSIREQVIAQVRATIAENGFVRRKGRSDEPRPDVEEWRPPDFGPEGPSDAEIDEEISKLMQKLARLRNPGGGNPGGNSTGDYGPKGGDKGDEFPLKKPGHVQIDVAFLIDIIVELFKLILKLRKRMQRQMPGG